MENKKVKETEVKKPEVPEEVSYTDNTEGACSPEFGGCFEPDEE